MLARNASEFEFLRRLKRTKAAARTRICYLDKVAAGIPVKKKKKTINIPTSHGDLLDSRISRPTPKMIEEQQRYLSAPMRPYALPGDPPIGYSALDRLMSQASASYV